MTTDLILPTTFELLPAGADGDTRYRLSKFTDWLTRTGRPLTAPDLAAYRDDLAGELAPATIRAHLSTIRGAYRRLMDNNDTRSTLYDLAPAGASAADRKAFVDELITRLENSIKPAAAPVTVITHQDRADSDLLRLTRKQAEALLNAPGLNDLAGLRDTAVIALLLCTGIREAELCALDVPDLRRQLGGELALHVRRGKGAKERLVPYGELSWCLVLVDAWREAAGVESGAVFRGLHKGGKLRPGRLSVRAVEYIVGSYPIAVTGDLRRVKVHDLRRTYARRLYEAGSDLLAIQQNLGHRSQDTTLGYIGALNVDRRRAPDVYTFDLSKLPTFVSSQP